MEFPSRNRGSFGFKLPSTCRAYLPLLLSFNLVIEVLLVSRIGESSFGKSTLRFNLVIEVLLVSRSTPAVPRVPRILIPFQSRNRGSFGFKSRVG